VSFFMLGIPYILQPTTNIGWVRLLFQLLSSGVIGIMFGSFSWVYVSRSGGFTSLATSH